MENKTQGLLRRVARRQRAVLVASRFHFFLLVLAAAYALLLLCSRLLGVIPNWFSPVNLLTVAAAALALAVAFYRRPSLADTAHLLDRRMETDDLFLTSALIDASPGTYKPLVLKMAEERAAAIESKRVVPFLWTAGTRNAILALAVLLAGILLLPQLDPFGKDEQRSRVIERQRQLQDSRKATALRVEMLQGKAQDAELSEEVQIATEELTQAFNAMQQSDKQGNLKRLNEHQAQLGELWRSASEKRLRDALSQAGQPQQFGERGEQKAAELRQQLGKGDASGMKQEIANLKELAQQLAQTSDAAGTRDLADELKQRIEQLSDALGREMSSGSLDAALQRALDQLAMAQMAGLSSEALEAVQESLELSELESEALAQSVRDIEALEEALQTLQLAKRLNEMQPLDGQAYSALKGVKDYAALFEELPEGGQAGGEDITKPGTGTAALTPEKPYTETAFKTEKSESALRAGKALLSMRTSSVAEPGEAVLDYQQYVEQVKQGVSEAILHEQIPPAYYEAVRGYFDSIEKEHEGAEKE